MNLLRQQFPNRVWLKSWNRHGGTRPAGKQASFLRNRVYECQRCGHQISPCVAPMENTHAAYAMLFSTSRHGGPLRSLSGNWNKTAWRMAHEIRKYMAEVDGEIPLGGIVEADETYVGGKKSGGKRDAAHPARRLCSG